MKIGIFDSGIGGLTVLHQAMRVLPEERYLYYADADHVPYGEKTKGQIIRYADQAIGFLRDLGAKADVVACNTATSAAIGFLRKKYRFPILGMEPAVKPAVETCKGKRVMVVATPVTVREDKLKNLLQRVDREHAADLLALPGLVSFAEREEFDTWRVREYLEEAFRPYDLTKYSALVLGCTHFNYFKDTFAGIFPPGVALIDGCRGTVNNLARILREMGLQGPGEPGADYFISGRKVEDAPTLQKIGRLHRRLEKMLRY